MQWLLDALIALCICGTKHLQSPENPGGGHLRPAHHQQFFFFQAEDGIRDFHVTGVQTCALPISNGTGQVLVYPYYTVQSTSGNSWNTFLSVVNTTSSAKAVKVRFLEGKTSSEVLDFNLFLSPNDVWTGAVVPSSSAAGAPAMLITADNSCTSPQVTLAGTTSIFRNFQYAAGVGGV